ncbi:hypothetical protein [Devosia sp.]|nr:hypothetical protein [Devosia sp.]MDP2778841.1 hypothetical protein [Devosia sp.]
MAVTVELFEKCLRANRAWKCAKSDLPLLFFSHVTQHFHLRVPG